MAQLLAVGDIIIACLAGVEFDDNGGLIQTDSVLFGLART